ncbi:MAG: oxidoreductase [Phenylobacterium sp. RIFCSPHIGHO2_01_FULL_70_10]|nr:MAG: oxidoreductase [Phenylobacterium sp. RIFCSPHIGHO2_01_FULL_70_10]
MKAVRIHEFGGPEALRIEDQPLPEPAAGEILVRVQASSVNPVDFKMRNGGYVEKDKLPLTLGRDVAGTVDRVGHGVFDFAPGDAVYALLPWDRGGHAEFVSAPARICARKPERCDFVQAAAAPLAALTAWQGLFDHGGLKEGQTVLIHGANGGVGHFAVQFAAVAGATVAATCRGEDRDFVRSLGATHVVDYRAERFEAAVPRVDLVLDLVGGETQRRSFEVLGPGGMLVSTLGEPDAEAAAGSGAKGVGFLVEPNGEQLAMIARLIDLGRVMPTIDQVFPLEQAAAAERRLETEHVRGKIVVRLP